MDKTLFLEFAAPVVLGLLCHVHRCANGPGISGSSLFLAAQLALIYAAGFATLPGLVLIVVLLGSYAGLGSKRGRAADALAAAAFAGFIAYWVSEKYLVGLAATHTWLRPIADHAAPYALVGVSYIGFKFIHFHIDRGSGEIEKFAPLEFMSWLLFFPSIVAGPMQRFQDWTADRRAGRLRLNALIEGAESIVLGFFMKVVLANSIRGYSLAALGEGSISVATKSQLFIATVVYPFYLYWDFAGYSHIATGIGKFWGVNLPENFNHPFIARNLAVFWTRWHISLSTLLRDYLYYPLSLVVKRRQFFQDHPDLSAAVPPVLTFLAVGIWHGLGVGFVIYGFLQGIGLAYIAIARRRKNRSAFAQWWLKSKAGAVGGAVFNYGYVAFSFIFFALSDHNLLTVYHRMVHAVPPVVG